MFVPLAQHGPLDSSWPIPPGFLGTSPFRGGGLPPRGCRLTSWVIRRYEGRWTEMHFVGREWVTRGSLGRKTLPILLGWHGGLRPALENPRLSLTLCSWRGAGIRRAWAEVILLSFIHLPTDSDGCLLHSNVPSTAMLEARQESDPVSTLPPSSWGR